MGFAQAYYDLGEQRRRISYITVPATAAEEIGKPEGEELKVLYADNKERFTAPEYRTFDYILLAPKDLAGRVKVPEEDITALYEFHKDKYIIAEKRAVRQIMFDTAKNATAAHARLNAGEDYIKIANERGFSANDTDLGTVTQKAMVDPKFGVAAFALKKPGITAPVEGAFGFAILKVESITPGSERKLAEVHDELVAERGTELAKNLVFDLMRDIENGRAGGQTLEEVAQAHDLKLQKATKVSRGGLTTKGATPEGLGAIPLAVLAQAFDSDIGDDNDFAETANASGIWFVTSVEDAQPSALKPYDDVRADVITLWQEGKRRDALLAHGATLAEKARAGEPLETLAATYGGRVITPVDPIARNATDDNLTQALVADAFKTGVGDFVDGMGQGNKGYVIAKILETVEAPGDQKLFAVANIESGLERALQQDISEHYIATLEQRYGVKRDSRAIDAALGRTTPSSP